MTAFLDTNVVIALGNPSDSWHLWANARVSALRRDGPLLVSDIVYSEWSAGMRRRSDLDQAIAILGLQRYPCSDDALFRAGQAFVEYRRNKGQSKRVLPDMIIGALAETEQLPLVTANPGDFATYFPSLNLIKP